MQIRVYIEPNGDVTITALVADLVPVAFSLDHTDLQMQRWLDVLLKADESSPLEFGPMVLSYLQLA